MYRTHIFYSDSALPDKLSWQILSFLRCTAPEGFQGVNEDRDWINKADDESIHIAITTVNDVLVSYCSVVKKYLRHEKEVYSCWGLTGVMTYPPFRNRGFGKEVVGIGTEIIKNSDADIGIFHCAHTLKEFYTLCGWEPMENTVTLIGNRVNPAQSTELAMMLFLSEKAKSHKSDFTRKSIYFGEDTW